MASSASNGPRSLRISPNLDALLEHDERTRRSKGRSWATSSTGSVGSSNEPYVQSLPPPPRKRKTAKSAKKEEDASSISPTGSTRSSPNPYVNPSPSFEGMPTTPPGDTLIDVPPRSSSILLSPTASEENYSIPSSPADSVAWKRNQVDKLLNRGKNAFGLFSEPSKTTLQQRAQKNKGKLLKLREVPENHMRSRSTSSGSTFDEVDDVSIRSTICFPSSSGHSHFYVEPPDQPEPADRISYTLVSPVSPSDMADDDYKPAKPPIPSSPKPDFSSPTLRKLTPKDPSNLLDAAERADLVRKSRKLAQVFGRTPEPSSLSQADSVRSSSLGIPHARHARASADNPRQKETVWPPADGTQYLTANGRRRHSSPLTPDQFSFLSTISGDDNGSTDIEIGPEQASSSSDTPVHPNVRNSPTSYIDLSEGETIDDGISAIISGEGQKLGRNRRPSSFSAQSLDENMTPEEKAEEERRRRREKLAKLHRFLGSRVPADLVLGLADSPSSSLPPMLPDMAMNDDVGRKTWLRRRRSSSAAVFPSNWDDDRLKEDLNDEEKAINVRRAVKMEKMFGVAPPQTLYHTRHAASASMSVPSLKPPSSRSTLRAASTDPQLTRNVNQSSYKYKSKNRPGTSESSKQLLPKGRPSEDYGDPDRGVSLVYTHYQHSLNSLNDIIDRDDKESLAELHQYLQDNDLSPSLQEFTLAKDRRMSIASVKSERRRSLPARTSMLSLVSESNIASPKPDVTDFQLRRRRAAKLTQFFGVDYRDLIRDVLDSIENGLEHERTRGTLKPEEAEDLLLKLRNLKTKRGGIY